VNGQFFLDSVKGLVVGRFKAGKTRLITSAWYATGMLDGVNSFIQRPALIIDCDGGVFSIPHAMKADPTTTYIGVSTEADWDRALIEARSGRYRLIIFDGWTNLFDKFAMFARDRNPGAKNKNMDWNREARDQVAEALEQWSDLAVNPVTRGVTLLSTASLQDAWTGEFPNRQFAGEKIKVAPTIEDRLVGRHTFVWHCTREDPIPYPDAAGRLDIERTNAAMKSGELHSRFLIFTTPFSGMPYVKSQEGFGADIPPIAFGAAKPDEPCPPGHLNLAAVLTARHAVEGVKSSNPNPT